MSKPPAKKRSPVQEGGTRQACSRGSQEGGQTRKERKPAARPRRPGRPRRRSRRPSPWPRRPANRSPKAAPKTPAKAQRSQASSQASPQETCSGDPVTKTATKRQDPRCCCPRGLRPPSRRRLRQGTQAFGARQRAGGGRQRPCRFARSGAREPLCRPALRRCATHEQPIAAGRAGAQTAVKKADPKLINAWKSKSRPRAVGSPKLLADAGLAST